MSPQTTQPSGQTPVVPVGTLAAEVIDGIDRGARARSRHETLTVGTAAGNDLVLTDPTVSRFHLELRATHDGIHVEDHGSTNGTRAGALRIVRVIVDPGALLDLGDSRIRVGEAQQTEAHLYEGDQLGDLIGQTPLMRRLMAQIERAAAADQPVLLVGESGTGKEVIARALHEEGPRRGGPFVTVDCGALSPSLIASELFGHEKGAFTGADRQHIGAFERAHGGTLFLDEVGELSTQLQPSLLGALERRRFRRVGGRDEVAVDVRLVSATNRDLRAEVNRSAFRLDLYYRLAVVVLRVPALREHPEDIPRLVEHFLREAGVEKDRSSIVPADTMAVLIAHRFDGNVRELRNIVEAMLAMGEAPELRDVHRVGDGVDDRGELRLPYGQARSRVLHRFERAYLTDALDRAGGNVSKAARLAHMDRSYLIKLLARHGLK